MLYSVDFPSRKSWIVSFSKEKVKPSKFELMFSKILLLEARFLIRFSFT
jgi:hypothetical protein